MLDILTNIAQAIYEFKSIFLTGYGIWGKIVQVLFFYQTIYILVGVLCTRKFEPAKKFHKYGIVIAARNEEKVIGNLLDSINRQDYPMEHVTVFVVADNCDDSTAEVARKHGAVVYERFDTEHRTKGFALQFLFNRIEEDYGTQNFEGYFVFDADNLLKSDFISRMNDAFDSGEKIITSYRNTKNIDENWIAASYAIHWMRSSRQNHRPRSVFRLATNIQGTGFLFASEIVKDGWKYTSLTEDRALTADAVVQGYKITYNDAAEFYDEQPTELRIALRQRIRWAKGHILAFKESGWNLFKNIFTYKGSSLKDTILQRIASYDMLVLVIPKPIIVVIKKTLKALICIISYTLSKDFLIWTLVYFVWEFQARAALYVEKMMVAAYVFVFDSKRIKKFSIWKKIWYTITWPLFDIIGKWSMYVALFKKVTWKPIPHNSKITIDDITTMKKARPMPAVLKRASKNAGTRIVCHMAFAIVSCVYSICMLNVSTDIFFMFTAVNLLLVGLHALCELRAKCPRVICYILMILTFVFNITLCCEVLGNGAITYVFSIRFLLNMILYAAPLILFVMLTDSMRASMIITALFWFATSSANLFLTEMRGRPLFLSDLYSIGTALNVAGQYKVDISAFYALTFLYLVIMISYFFIIEKLHEKRYFKFKWYWRYGVNSAILVGLVLSMSSSSLLAGLGVTPYFWSHKVNGFPLNFVMDLQYSSIEPPEGYDASIIDAMNDEYAEKDMFVDTSDPDSRPNVIVIMNESFADLRVIGDFDTNIDVTPYMDTLYEDESVISGYAYVSVFGGGTADSEYEFLTGDNMYVYPQGAIPYQTNFNDVDYIPSIVSTFNTLDYRTMAMHPYLPSGWNRPNIYSAMGFDEQLYIEDYETDPDLKYYRSYVSDESDFDKIIDAYEGKTDGEPLFIFNVTMQNHGGYKTRYRNFEQKIKLMNTEKEYPLAEQYLSLLHETDAAVKGLIEYFEKADEPTVIVFYGDHQVQIEDGFYEELYGKSLDDLTEEEMLLKYTTRFFIWSNYEMNEIEGYEQLTKLEADVHAERSASAEDASDVTDSSDAVSSDTAASDDADDADIPDEDGRTPEPTETPKPEKTPNADADRDDASNSDDVAGSDSVEGTEPEQTYVTQSKTDAPQIVTNLSYLSQMMFEAVGLPMSAYQNFLAELRLDYPVITAFDVIDSEGTYHKMGDKSSEIYDELIEYESAIYNRVFDRKNQHSSFFCLNDTNITVFNVRREFTRLFDRHREENCNSTFALSLTE